MAKKRKKTAAQREAEELRRLARVEARLDKLRKARLLREEREHAMLDRLESRLDRKKASKKRTAKKRTTKKRTTKKRTAKKKASKKRTAKKKASKKRTVRAGRPYWGDTLADLHNQIAYSDDPEELRQIRRELRLRRKPAAVVV